MPQIDWLTFIQGPSWTLLYFIVFFFVLIESVLPPIFFGYKIVIFKLETFKKHYNWKKTIFFKKHNFL